MRTLVQMALLALVAADAGQDEQFPMMVPNWGKILGKQPAMPAMPNTGYHGPQKKVHKEMKKDETEKAVKEVKHKKTEKTELKKAEETQDAEATHPVTYANGAHIQGFKMGKVEHLATNGKQLCTGRQYVEGSWKLLAQAPPKTFKCCSWDEGHGYWKNDKDKCQGAGRKFHAGPSGSKFISIGGHGCMCDSQLDQISKREMHTWEPSECSLPAFNSNKFCKALGHGKIHFFGDSTMQQAAATLMNMVIGGHNEEVQHCTPQITFHLSDYLVGAPDERGEKINFNKYDADIYVLGLGAWIHNKKKYSDTLDKVVEMIQKKQSEPNPPKFIWKTISGAGCGHINKISVENHDPSYTYDLFPTYDAMAREKLTPLGVKFVDLSPLYLRGDAHPIGQKDCLHFCAPGPVDIFPRVLHHVLQEELEE